jgi:hypothetical protein
MQGLDLTWFDLTLLDMFNLQRFHNARGKPLTHLVRDGPAPLHRDAARTADATALTIRSCSASPRVHST